LPAHHEEHAGLATGIHHGPDGGDISRPLGLEACREFVESLLFQWGASEIADRLAKAGAESIDVEAGDLRRSDDRALRHGRFLIGCRLRRDHQQRKEQSKCAHALSESKE
jgi:hypothetical protein